jgi:hypothetical protein
MPKRITINPHLSVKELENRYRAAKNPVERSHYQIVWLLAQGKTTEEVAAVTGYCREARVHWRYQWLWLYGFVHPESGETYFWILPRVNITLFNQVLADESPRIWTQ